MSSFFYTLSKKKMNKWKKHTQKGMVNKTIGTNSSYRSHDNPSSQWSGGPS